MEELAFNGDNPGSVRYGNFINYYQFHPADDRLKLLPNNIWTSCDSFIALDIGCNAGDLTLGLYKYLVKNVCKNCKILAIDIDPVLIKRANEQNTYNNITFKCVDFMDAQQRDILYNYLRNNNVNIFNAIFCFSITMWIHLNHGDTGLQTFLYEICNLTGTIMIEPQPWKCYKNAVKRLRLHDKKFSCYKDLKWKNPLSNIECLILKQGFQQQMELSEMIWNRKIFIFTKISC